MIHNTEYVRDLIRKSMEGSLTAQEAALLKAARRIYEKEEWERMMLDALDDANAQHPAGGRVATQPDWAGIMESAHRRKRMRARLAEGIRYGMVAAAMLIVFIGFHLYHRVRTPLIPSGVCAGMVPGMDIPVAEFASTIRYGDSANIRVDAGMQERIGQVGNLEIHRDGAGTLVLRAVREAMAADTVGHPSIRFVTAPFQQAEVLLPDGTRIRLNAGSTLTYPLLTSEPEISYAHISGEVLIRVPEKPRGQRLIIETVTSQVQTGAGEFAVLATDADTRITLLEGDLSVMSKQGRHQRVLDRPSSQAHIEWVRELNGRVTESLFYREGSKVEEIIGWTKTSRRYRDASLREFVADMSRWYGIHVKDIHCIPATKRVDALICYRAPLDEALAVVNKAGLRVHLSNGMYSFCDTDDGFQPRGASANRDFATCNACGQ